MARRLLSNFGEMEDLAPWSQRFLEDGKDAELMPNTVSNTQALFFGNLYLPSDLPGSFFFFGICFFSHPVYPQCRGAHHAIPASGPGRRNVAMRRENVAVAGNRSERKVLLGFLGLVAVFEGLFSKW